MKQFIFGILLMGVGLNLSCKSKVQLSGVETKSTPTFQTSVCSTPDCKVCVLPSGEKLLSGARVPLFKKQNSGCGLTCQAISAEVVCNDGKIEGADPQIYSFISCESPIDCKPCQLPCGKTIYGGMTDSCFSQHRVETCGLTCMPYRKKYGCNDGVLTNEDGSVASASSSASASFGIGGVSLTTGTVAFTYPTCSESAVCKSCLLPNGQTVKDGAQASFFKRQSLSCGQSCTSTDNHVLLTCSNGVFANRALHPDFVYSSCSTECTGANPGDQGPGRIEGDGGGAPNSACPLPWGTGVVTHNTKVTAYARKSVACGQSCAAHRKVIQCNGYRGLWSGGPTYIYEFCLELACP